MNKYTIDKHGVADHLNTSYYLATDVDARISKLEAGLIRCEQTIRNLGNGFLTGDGKEIALNESRNIVDLLGGTS